MRKRERGKALEKETAPEIRATGAVSQSPSTQHVNDGGSFVEPTECFLRCLEGEARWGLILCKGFPREWKRDAVVHSSYSGFCGRAELWLRRWFDFAPRSARNRGRPDPICEMRTIGPLKLNMPGCAVKAKGQ